MARYLKGRQNADGWMANGLCWTAAPRSQPDSGHSHRDAPPRYTRPRRNEPNTRKPFSEQRTGLPKRRGPQRTKIATFRLISVSYGPVANSLRLRARAGSDLLREQRPDGGWAQLPTLASDAYATGQALVALKEVGVLKPSDPAYKRGAQFLMNTQMDDGSWYVRSRTPIPFQPYFESGFPFGHDQFISAAATNWAAMALAPLAH